MERLVNENRLSAATEHAMVTRLHAMDNDQAVKTKIAAFYSLGDEMDLLPPDKDEDPEDGFTMDTEILWSTHFTFTII